MPNNPGWFPKDSESRILTLTSPETKEENKPLIVAPKSVIPKIEKPKFNRKQRRIIMSQIKREKRRKFRRGETDGN